MFVCFWFSAQFGGINPSLYLNPEPYEEKEVRCKTNKHSNKQIRNTNKQTNKQKIAMSSELGSQPRGRGFKARTSKCGEQKRK